MQQACPQNIPFQSFPTCRPAPTPRGVAKPLQLRPEMQHDAPSPHLFPLSWSRLSSQLFINKAWSAIAPGFIEPGSMLQRSLTPPLSHFQGTSVTLHCVPWGYPVLPCNLTPPLPWPLQATAIGHRCAHFMGQAMLPCSLTPPLPLREPSGRQTLRLSKASS